MVFDYEATSRAAGAVLPCGSPAPGRCAFDDAHRASGSLLTSPPNRRRPSTAPGGAPRAAALSTACTVELRTPLTLPVASRPPANRGIVKPEPSCPTSRQRERTRLGSKCRYSTNARPMSLSRTSIRTRHRSRDFAVVVRLPALIRSMMLAHVRARPRSLRGVPLRKRTRPGAVRRCLQPNRFASTTVDDPEPRAPQRRSPAIAAPAAGGYVQRAQLFSALARGQPRRHGPGVACEALPPC